MKLYRSDCKQWRACESRRLHHKMKKTMMGVEHERSKQSGEETTNVYSNPEYSYVNIE